MSISDTRIESSTLAGVWLARAWVAVLLSPVFFLVAFAASRGLYSMFGYPSGTDDIPLAVDVAATVAVLPIYLFPCVAAVRCGWQANSVGARLGVIPLVIGVLAALAVTGAGLVTIFSG